MIERLRHHRWRILTAVILVAGVLAAVVLAARPAHPDPVPTVAALPEGADQAPAPVVSGCPTGQTPTCPVATARPGKRRRLTGNPFAGDGPQPGSDKALARAAAKAQRAATASAGPRAAGTPDSAGTPSPAGTPGGAVVPAPGGAATPAPPVPVATVRPTSPAGTIAVHQVDVRVSRIGTPGAIRRDIPRYRALPSTARPYLTYLGPTARGTRATFVVGQGVGVLGGRCLPSRRLCGLVVAGPGDQVVFGVSTHDAWQIEIPKVHETRVQLAQTASETGRCRLQDLGLTGRGVATFGVALDDLEDLKDDLNAPCPGS